MQLCLTEAHVRCERFAAARTAWLAASSGLPRVAPDVAFGRTRLILEPEPAWRKRGAPTARFPGRNAILFGLGAVVVAGFMLASATGLLGGAPASSASPSPTASVSEAATPTLAPASASAVASASLAPSPSLAPVVTPTPAPTPVTYVVQSGDTLNQIALLFGTTAQAIAAANGIAVTDPISPGQRLIIP